MNNYCSPPFESNFIGLTFKQPISINTENVNFELDFLAIYKLYDLELKMIKDIQFLNVNRIESTLISEVFIEAMHTMRTISPLFRSWGQPKMQNFKNLENLVDICWKNLYFEGLRQVSYGKFIYSLFETTLKFRYSSTDDNYNFASLASSLCV